MNQTDYRPKLTQYTSRLAAIQKQIDVLQQQIRALQIDRRYLKRLIAELEGTKVFTTKRHVEAIKILTCGECRSTLRVQLTREGPKCATCRWAKNLSTEV